MAKESKTSAARAFQKAMHRFRVLDLIRTTGLISRIEIARQTGLSQASITGITAEFIKEGLIEEKKTGAYKGGRRPILLAINPDGVHVVGINLTVTQIRIVIINFEAEIKASRIVPLEKPHYEPNELIDIIGHHLQGVIWDNNFSKEQIAGVGVGLPGLVDFDSGVVKFLPNYGWTEIAFREMLQKKINHRVFLDNSSNNLTIAEHWYGKGLGVNDFLVITIENGVGAGIISNGQLIRGNAGVASEFGHNCMDPDGPMCRCGRNGCIEAYAGNNAIIRDARQLVEQGSWKTERTDAGQITLADIIRELEAGNEQLIELYTRAGKILGQGLFNFIILLNPQLIIVTGKGVTAGEYLFTPLLETLNKLRKGRNSLPETNIIIEEWDDANWAKGAGTLVLREIYKSPSSK